MASRGYRLLASSAGRSRRESIVGSDLDTSFVVARDVDKGLAGILNAVIPGVGTAASGITQLWLDPLQKGVTHKDVVKPAGGGIFAAQTPVTDAEKKSAAEKAIVDAGASKVKADARPSDALLAQDAKADAQRAAALAIDAKILVPVKSKQKPSVWPKVAIAAAVVGGLGAVALVLKYTVFRRAA